MFKYEIVIYWDDTDNCYIAEVPDLAGCLAHGKSYDEALFQAQEAIKLWIDTAQKFGDLIPEPKARKLASA